MPKSLAITFAGKTGGVKLNPSAEVDNHLAEMQMAVVTVVSRLGDKNHIEPLQGTFLLEKLKTGLLFDQRAAAQAAAAAALRTAFFMDQVETQTSRPEKITNFELAISFTGNREILLRCNFNFQDGSSSKFESPI